VSGGGYAGLTRAELDRAYSPSSVAPGFRTTLAGFAADGARARSELPCALAIPYGPEPCERFDFFPAGRPRSPLQVFVHGGHWQELGREDSSFLAFGLVGAGASFAALGYGLAPHYSLGAMVGQVRRALRWMRERADELGIDPDRVHVSGSSAGAHLAAMALCGDGLDVAGACLLSGVYDLEPVRHSYVNDLVGMDERTARDNSPLHHLPLGTPDVIVARGERETGEYARQHALFAKSLRGRGDSATARTAAAGAAVRDLVVPGRDHFALPGDLADPDTALGAAVLSQMGLAGEPDAAGHAHRGHSASAGSPSGSSAR
jgi:arylformamidase